MDLLLEESEYVSARIIIRMEIKAFSGDEIVWEHFLLVVLVAYDFLLPQSDRAVQIPEVSFARDQIRC